MFLSLVRDFICIVIVVFLLFSFILGLVDVLFFVRRMFVLF